MSALVFNRRLLLEEKHAVADGAGGFEETWVSLGFHWGSLRAERGRSRGESGVAVSSVPYRITLRAAPVSSPARPRAGQRFRVGARVFSIDAVAENSPGPLYLTCFAKEEAAA